MVLAALPVASAAAEKSATPPAFPDAIHVTRGCFVSTAAYIARYLERFPAETARPLSLAPRNFDGPHTIALVTWQGRWWARDEYSGVFALDYAAASAIRLEQLRRRAEDRLRRLADRQLRTGGISAGPDACTQMSISERERDIAHAAALLPFPSTIVRVGCGAQRVPFLFFQPRAGQIAVYDPATGTATSESTPVDVPALVVQVAARLGYRVDAKR